MYCDNCVHTIPDRVRFCENCGVPVVTADTDHLEQDVKSRHVIYVNQVLGHNQVYADDADFDLVRNHIVEHCPNPKITA